MLFNIPNRIGFPGLTLTFQNLVFIPKSSKHFFTKNDKIYVNIFENQDSSLMKNLSLANCLVKVPAKKIALKSDFLEIYELNNGL